MYNIPVLKDVKQTRRPRSFRDERKEKKTKKNKNITGHFVVSDTQDIVQVFTT